MIIKFYRFDVFIRCYIKNDKCYNLSMHLCGIMMLESILSNRHYSNYCIHSIGTICDSDDYSVEMSGYLKIFRSRHPLKISNTSENSRLRFY